MRFATPRSHYVASRLPTLICWREHLIPRGEREGRRRSRMAQFRTSRVILVSWRQIPLLADENIRLQNLWDGIETMTALMQME
jgi:hypothetical protein